MKIQMQNPTQEPLASSKDGNQDLKDMKHLCTYQIKIESQNLNHWCTKDQYQIKIKIQMPNSSQEPPVSSKTLNKDREDMDVLHIFKIKILNIGISNPSDHIQIRIKMPNPSQEPPASFKTPYQDLKDMDGLWTLKSR